LLNIDNKIHPLLI